jgi:hypothetical protein
MPGRGDNGPGPLLRKRVSVPALPAPAFADLDGAGDLDLAVNGGFTGSFQAYERDLRPKPVSRLSVKTRW